MRTQNAGRRPPARCGEYTRPISDRDAVPELAPSERLARRWFTLVQQGAFEQLADLVHEDVLIVSKVRAGTTVEGRDAVVQFIREILTTSLYEAVAGLYAPLDEDRIVVEGRMRWIDDERIIRDDPVIWAMEFRDGLLLRFIPARTSIEAEAILATPR